LIASLGSITDTLTLTGDYAYANDLKVGVRGLTNLAKDHRLGGPGLIMGDKYLLVGCWDVPQTGSIAN